MVKSSHQGETGQIGLARNRKRHIADKKLANEHKNIEER
jgi:hypothetical protein